MGDEFAASAQGLAGLAGALLGWRPDEFWRATPAELACVIDALKPAETPAADTGLVTRLLEQFPDG